jgi:hypothetical protein
MKGRMVELVDALDSKSQGFHKLLTSWYSLGHSERANTYFLFLALSECPREYHEVKSL